MNQGKCAVGKPKTRDSAQYYYNSATFHVERLGVSLRGTGCYAMSKPFGFVGGLFSDGFKALGLFSWLLSGIFTIAKIYDAVSWLRHIDYAWALLPITVWLLVAYYRRWTAYQDQVEAPRPPATSLTPISVTDIAEYILADSEWAWRKRLSLTMWGYVRDRISSEMTRAGRTGLVRYIGVAPHPFSAGSVEIDQSYWASARIDDDRVWDKRNRTFTTYFGSPFGQRAIAYEHGIAPRVEVMRTWPKASLPLRWWIGFRLFLRRARYGFPKSLREPLPESDVDVFQDL